MLDALSLPMILALYALVATCLVLLSSKASVYVDLLDRKTTLSGAFIGGVMLSAVTSLPELFTSLSSALLLHQPGLSMGNILGSNLFNLALLGVLVFLFARSFSKAAIHRGHFIVAVFTLMIYAVLWLHHQQLLSLQILNISLTSLIIAILYIWGIRSLSGDGKDEPGEDTNPLSVRQVCVRFAMVAVGIVALSIIITYLTDAIATAFNLGQGLAGALFLGIATSLPELASSVALFRMGNHNIALGNIIGSNLFNFMILSITDLVYWGQGVYDFSDPKTVNLLVFGAVATPLFMLLTRFNRRIVCIATALGLVGCYMAFLVV